MLFKKQNTSLALLVFFFICPLFAQTENYLAVTNATNAAIQCGSTAVDTAINPNHNVSKPDTAFPIEAGKESHDEIPDWSTRTIKNKVFCFWNSDNKMNQGEAVCATNIVTVSGEFDKIEGKPIVLMQVSC